MVALSLFRNIANKSSLSYISCYAKAGVPHIYLQRGYRNYGIPQVIQHSFSQILSVK